MKLNINNHSCYHVIWLTEDNRFGGRSFDTKDEAKSYLNEIEFPVLYCYVFEGKEILNGLH